MSLTGDKFVKAHEGCFDVHGILRLCLLRQDLVTITNSVTNFTLILGNKLRNDEDVRRVTTIEYFESVVVFIGEEKYI